MRFNTDYNLILWMSWLDIRRRYVRTLFGFSWNTITFLAFVICLSLVWAGLWGVNVKEYLPYLMSGVLSWNFISGTINDSTSTLREFSGILKDKKFEYAPLSWIVVLRNAFLVLPNIAVALVINSFLLSVNLMPVFYWVLICVPLTLFILYKLCVVLSYVCMRFQDVRQVVSTIMLVTIFVTPVLWTLEQISDRAGFIISLNPFVHVLSVFRFGIIFQYPSVTSVFLVLLFAGVLHVFQRILEKKLVKKLWIYL